ncbi:Arm DNA-binding domain-containing protein [Vibrio diazotrophicus]|uniref:Arm DNA-binding domain-containing protein n=1 Tax=Vibrio diazotrophicus TaxID=685 RepID=UPI004032F02D
MSYARTAAENKKYSDGNGLYFCVRKSGMPYWMLRYTSLNGLEKPRSVNIQV